MHIYTFCPSLQQSFRKFCGVALTNCFRSIFHLGQISKLKKGVTPRKIIELKFPVDMRIYTLSFITTKFHEILLSGLEELR